MAEENKNDNKKNKLKEVKKILYTKGFKTEPINSDKFRKKEFEINDGWEESSIKQPSVLSKQKMSMVKKIFIASVVFFVIAVGFVVFTFWRGNNVVSVKNIDISISGPVSVNGGEKFVLEVDIENKSDLAIESASLLIEYPKGSYESFDSQDELSREREVLKGIEPGASFSKTISLALFGEENSEKEINFILEFRFKDSSATLEKTEAYKVRISSSPINLSFLVPKEANLKQEFEMTVSLESNSSNTIKGLLLQVEYPFGFTFVSASPAPVSGDNTWDMGDLVTSDKRIITIRGIVEGQEGDEKVFRASAGTKSKGENSVIGTIYSFVSESMELTEPFLAVSLLLNGSSEPEYVSSNERMIRADILWESNILTRIIDGRLEVKLKGEKLDKFSVLVNGGGFYRSIDNTITWDKTRNKNLAIIEPGGKGSVSFNFKPLPSSDENGNILENPQITIKASAQGKRISETNVPEEVATSIIKKVKIESELDVITRAVYYVGPFKNSGPLPPIAEKETTYTIIWAVINSSNNVSDVVVKTTLPTYITWLGVVSPTSEDVSFNKAGGEVVWNVGNVDRGTGLTSSPREVAFQIRFLPSISQVNRKQFLTGETTLIGEDTFTETSLKDIVKELSTELSTDPFFNRTQTKVTY